ncbi:MAG: peptidoglycan-binding protein, partial [Pseudomonadota bacterium]
NELGFGAGPPDGLFGQRTAGAIRNFQEINGLTPTGQFDDELMLALYEARGTGDPPTGHLYVRQNHRDVFDVNVAIKDPDRPLGTHLFTALPMRDIDTTARWIGMTASPADGMTPGIALDRVVMPDAVRERLSLLLTSGSSLIVSDRGLGPETGKGTDFIVLT